MKGVSASRTVSLPPHHTSGASPAPLGRPLRFQAGGTLGEDAFYVERPADQELPEALARGELCYVLTTRQMGKSSLRVRVMARLEAQGIACASIDLTAIGTDNATVATWYYGLTSEIAEQLGLDEPDEFWDRNVGLGPVHCFSRYLEDEILDQVARSHNNSDNNGNGGGQVVVFIDEIDATLSLPFPRDDFFAAIRALYNRRAERLANRRLTFCLLGVAEPAELIEDPTRTPFNIGRAIRLEDFTREEMALFERGLDALLEEPGPSAAARLDEIFDWTSGHPYMTQRICEDLVSTEQGFSVDRVVHARFLAPKRIEDPNLSDAEKRFDLRDTSRPGRRHTIASTTRIQSMLQLYRCLLTGEQTVTADPGDPIQLALRLTGMAAERHSSGGPQVLQVRNRVFRQVFDAGWIRRQEADRAIAAPLALWLESQRSDDFALGGKALAGIQEWAEGRSDLTPDEQAFLRTCVRVEGMRTQATMRRHGRKVLIAVLSYAVIVLAGLLVAVGWQYQRAESEALRALSEAARATREKKNAEQQTFKAEEERRRANREARAARKAEKQAKEEARKAQEAKSRADENAAQAKTARRQVRAEATHARRSTANSDVHRLALLSEAASEASNTIRRQLLAVETFRSLARASRSMVLTALRTLSDAVNGISANTPLVGHAGQVVFAAFSPDGNRVVTVSHDKTARVWRADDTRQPVVLRGHDSAVVSAAFSPDGSWIATASADNTARVWRADGTGQPVILRGHDEAVINVAFSPNGSRVVTASNDNTARVWRADGTGQPVILRGHDKAVIDAAFSPNGSRVVTASDDTTARVWRADGTGQPVVLRGHDNSVNSAAFSPNGLWVVTASEDKTARVWRADGTGQPVVLDGHDNAVRNAAFSPDG